MDVPVGFQQCRFVCDVCVKRENMFPAFAARAAVDRFWLRSPRAQSARGARIVCTHDLPKATRESSQETRSRLLLPAFRAVLHFFMVRRTFVQLYLIQRLHNVVVWFRSYTRSRRRQSNAVLLAVVTKDAQCVQNYVTEIGPKSAQWGGLHYATCASLKFGGLPSSRVAEAFIDTSFFAWDTIILHQSTAPAI